MHTLLVREGAILGWGDEELLPGYSPGLLQPQKLTGPIGIVSCSSGKQTLALTKDGVVYYWKNGSPTAIALKQKCRYVACGPTREIVVTVVGEVYTSNGSNSWSAVSGLTSIVTAAVCRYHFAAISEAGALYVWRNSDYPGNGGLSPQQVERDTTFVSVVCNNDCTLAISEQGSLFKWDKQIFENGYMNRQNKPTIIDIDDNSIRLAACGDSHVMAVTKSGLLYVWGSNDFGQLGLGTRESHKTPQHLNIAKNVKVESIYCGSAHSVAVLADGSVWSWGKNDKGQLGLGDKIGTTTPQRISSIPLYYIPVQKPQFIVDTFPLPSQDNYCDKKVATSDGHTLIYHTPVVSYQCPNLLKCERLPFKSDICKLLLRFIYSNHDSIFRSLGATTSYIDLLRLAKFVNNNPLITRCQEKLVLGFHRGM
jgi:alpha-tubulin suppressor-like RCC1 family protein